MGGLAVGVDIGGTKVAAGLVAADGSVLARLRADTPVDDPDAIVPRTAEIVAELTARLDAATTPVGVGAAGIVDLDGVVRYAPNVGWVDYPLAERLGAVVPGPVTVDNDANVAAWAEFCCGAGRRARASMVMLTLGTGVGGGLVEHGALVRGAQGLGAEFGHVIVLEGGVQCPCGNRGCLEAYASGTAIARLATERLAAGSVPAGSRLHGLPALTGKAVTLAAHDGDEAARAILAEAGFWLGVGIASLVNALDPEIVIVGGGAMQAGELLLAPARIAFEQRLMGRGQRTPPPVERSGLADDAGFVGAALLALREAAAAGSS